MCMDFFRCKFWQTPPGKNKIELCQEDENIFEKAKRYIITFVNNIKWVWHIFVRADIAFYTFCTRNIHLIITKVGHLQCISRFWTSTMFPLYISDTWSYCSHSDRNFPEAQTEHKQTRHVEEKKTQKDNEKREKLISCPSGRWHPLYPLCHFFLICYDGQNLPSLFLWDDCFTEVPGDTFFLCLSSFSSLSSSQWLPFPCNFMN